MLLGGCTMFHFHSNINFTYFYKKKPAVCFKHLSDTDNAYLAFERAAMLPEAIKNPLIYLNFAIHCYETGRIEQSQLNLSNFAKMTEQTKVRMEVKVFECE